MVWTILITLVVSSCATILYLNLRASEKQIRYQLEHLFGVEDPQFMREMGQLLGPQILPGNEVAAYHNGDQIFPAMLEAIRSAQKSITFETFIYWAGDIGLRFSDALSERAKAGVKVHVLLDWFGTGRIDAKYLDQLKSAGVEVERYHPIRWYTLARLNNRTHRKLLVIDGRIGFTGGVGIADEWTGNAQSPDHWRDSHFRIKGPAVAQMQAAFNSNWIKTRAAVLHGDDYFPELVEQGSAPAQLFKSSISEGSESARLMYLLAISSARKDIRLQAAYFVPDGMSIDTLVAARERGVNIEIILPGPVMDSKVVQKASRTRWGDLLDAGVRLYEYQPTMYHCKVMIVDGFFVSVGSTNFDDRSFRLNDEANLNVFDASLAADLLKVFEDDKKKSRPVRKEDLTTRSPLGKCTDEIAAIFRRQL